MTRPFVINRKQYKMNNHNGWWRSMFQKTFTKKILHNATCKILINQWKVTSTWHHQGSCKLVALKLHTSYSYIIVTNLHELHMYMVSYMVSCIPCNSCDLSNSTHVHRNMLSCNELQMVIVTQKPNCKVSFKSPHFFTMCKLFKIFLTNNYL